MSAPSIPTAAVKNFEISAPHGARILIPERGPELPDYYPPPGDSVAVRRYFDEQGYVVLRGVLPTNLCDRVYDSFAREVKPYGGYIYRQTTANPERHVFTDAGFVLNPILNVQDLSSSAFPIYKQSAYEVLTHPFLHAALLNLLGEPGTVVQSMHFEGNPSTWAHQDTYYLDSTRVGTLIAAWIALEDIAPGAGRFFVYPGSHRIDMTKNGGDFDYAFNHDRYQSLVIDVIRKHGLPCHAPALNKGDILLWGSRTIHGSLETVQPNRSRSSMTAHFIPASTRLLQFQARLKPLRLREVHGVKIHHPKNQDLLRNRLILWVETRFPSLFQLGKKIAIKLVTSLQRAVDEPTPR